MIARLLIDDLSLRRGERTLFRGLALDLAAGHAVAVTGANGVGKTSLLRAIAGFLRPEAGRIRFEGAAGPLDPDVARGAHAHFLGHEEGLKAHRGARGELLFQVGWTGGAAQSALDAARRLGLAACLDLPVRRLSAGQRRRLALCRLVAAPRDLWLLDEPFAPLDVAGRALLGQLMAGHLAAGGLIVAAVHDPLPIPAAVLEISP